MTAEQIRSIVRTGALPGPSASVELVETHISWVLLTPTYAFKIKKPVTLGFLDFGTLDKRLFYCTEELRLNRRLAPEMYLGILPVVEIYGLPEIRTNGEPVIDYAVQMLRMDNQRQMDRLLQQNKVTGAHMAQLAQVLAAFHRKNILSAAPGYHPASHWADFAELYRYREEIEQYIGPAGCSKMQRWRSQLPEFLERHSTRLVKRLEDGFWVDGHGDLHTRNIFLPEEGPVVFDCLEFSEHFRKSDILNELAFLCMDLEARGHAVLARDFLRMYRKHWEVLPLPEDELLFRFFKAYRANVRLKVALLELRQHPAPKLEEQAKTYWQLLEEYLAG